jgi:hypothetical protein
MCLCVYVSIACTGINPLLLLPPLGLESERGEAQGPCHMLGKTIENNFYIEYILSRPDEAL